MVSILHGLMFDKAKFHFHASLETSIIKTKWEGEPSPFEPPHSRESQKRQKVVNSN